MIVTDYTTNDEVRSLLGVSSKELADTVIALPHWALATELELQDMVGGASTVATQYDTIRAMAPGDRTAAQTLFYNVTRMYVLYHIGGQLLQRADVFSPTSITDGKAAIDRLAERFDKLRPAIEGGVERLKERVKAALVALDPSAAIEAAGTRIYAIGVGLGTDPVTGA